MSDISPLDKLARNQHVDIDELTDSALGYTKDRELMGEFLIGLIHEAERCVLNRVRDMPIGEFADATDDHEREYEQWLLEERTDD
jgi:hypothetical protein